MCDLLVVFEDHILIFSDKYIKFPNTGDLDTDWARWVRKAILNSGKQLSGAERWIKDHPNQLFIDHACKQSFPINLPEMAKAKFHRIIVAHGASERCISELGGSGSLMLISTIIGDNHLKKRSDGGIPFAVGQINPDCGFFHILDDTSLNILISTLDTISDFTSYLEKKELLFSNRKSIFAAGEEELLAVYLGDINHKKEHDFIFDEHLDGISIDQGFWERFITSNDRKSQVKANRDSYAWDSLIERFTTHILNGTQYFHYPPEPCHQERILRFLAREPRTRRRLLVRTLFELMKRPATQKWVNLIAPSNSGDPYYIFLILPRLGKILEIDYREIRMNLLYSYCLVLKKEFTEAQDIIGIATEPGNEELRSEDLVFYDARNWTVEIENEAIRLQQELGLLNKMQKFKSQENEYPNEK